MNETKVNNVVKITKNEKNQRQRQNQKVTRESAKQRLGVLKFSFAGRSTASRNFKTLNLKTAS
jgi:hypothetical protein